MKNVGKFKINVLINESATGYTVDTAMPVLKCDDQPMFREFIF